MFKQNLEKINYPEVEKNILEFWEKNKIFEKSISSRDENNLFTFYEGPPTAKEKPVGIPTVCLLKLKLKKNLEFKIRVRFPTTELQSIMLLARHLYLSI